MNILTIHNQGKYKMILPVHNFNKCRVGGVLRGAGDLIDVSRG